MNILKTNDLDEKYINLLENKKIKHYMIKYYIEIWHINIILMILIIIYINYDDNIFKIIVDDITDDGFLNSKIKMILRFILKRLKN